MARDKRSKTLIPRIAKKQRVFVLCLKVKVKPLTFDLIQLVMQTSLATYIFFNSLKKNSA
jgi:hypothetical protein